MIEFLNKISEYKQLAKASIYDFLPYNELVRFKSENSDFINVNQDYWINNIESRQVFLDIILQPDFFDDIFFFSKKLIELNKISALGLNQKRNYYVNEKSKIKLSIGRFRLDNLVSRYKTIGYEVANQEMSLNKREYYETINYNKKVSLILPNLSVDVCPINEGIKHIYPSSKFIGLYFIQMQERLKNFQAQFEQKDLSYLINEIIWFYIYAVNIRPFNHINNSLFMNIFNTLLHILGLKGISHFYFDYIAQRLCSDSTIILIKREIRKENKLPLI